MSEQPKDDKHWEQYRKPKESKMKFDLKVNNKVYLGSTIPLIT